MSNNVLEHRGYLGTVEFDLEDEYLFGSVQFIQGAISYDGDTIAKLKSSFGEAIDAYIDACQRRGIDPIKPFTGTFQIRPGPELHRQIAMAALTAGLSLNEWVRVAIVEKLALKLAQSVTVFSQYSVAMNNVQFVGLGQGTAIATDFFSDFAPFNREVIQYPALTSFNA